LERLRERGATPLALEVNPRTRAALAGQGVHTWPAERKEEFLAQPMDAVVVNAAGGSLDAPAVARIAANGDVRVVCGSENLAMPDPAGAATLLRARQVYCPTELGGMMGYLTAVEEYLTEREAGRIDLETLYRTLFEASERLGVVGCEGTARVIRSGYRETFEEAVRREFNGVRSNE
jgi:hypothetical protein